MIEAINQFTEAMREAGLLPINSIIADGKIHRCEVEGDKPGKTSGWYSLHLDGLPAGAFGSWKTREQHSWCSKSSNELTQAEHEVNRQRLAEIKKQREAEEAVMHEAARKKACSLWDAARNVDSKHAYLTSKKVKPIGIKQLKNQLVIPLRVMVK